MENWASLPAQPGEMARKLGLKRKHFALLEVGLGILRTFHYRSLFGSLGNFPLGQRVWATLPTSESQPMGKDCLMETGEHCAARKLVASGVLHGLVLVVAGYTLPVMAPEVLPMAVLTLDASFHARVTVAAPWVELALCSHPAWRALWISSGGLSAVACFQNSAHAVPLHVLEIGASPLDDCTAIMVELP
jgi:hypothetical protein